nr:hypothetical protein [Tanacetum cinerariifolium]
MVVLNLMISSSANSTEYLVSIVDGTMSLKGLNLVDVRLISDRERDLVSRLRRMLATREGMSSVEIDQIMAQRVNDATEAFAIYETKIHMTHDLMNHVIWQETTVEKNANNKGKFEKQPKDNCVPQQPPSRNRMWQGLILLEPIKRRLMLGIYLTATSVSCIMLGRIL